MLKNISINNNSTNISMNNNSINISIGGSAQPKTIFQHLNQHFNQYFNLVQFGTPYVWVCFYAYAFSKPTLPSCPEQAVLLERRQPPRIAASRQPMMILSAIN